MAESSSAASAIAEVAAAAISIAPAKAELLSLVGYALLSTVACELVCWLLIFRGEQYERACEKFLSARGRLIKKKEEPPPAASKETKKDKKDKKLAMLERDFEIANRDLIALKSRSNMITAIFHILTFFILKNSLDEVVVARLPFVPFRFMWPMTHRNLPGTDPRDCSMIFIYVLCSMCLKPNLQRLFAIEPPKTEVPANITKLAERLTGVTTPPS